MSDDLYKLLELTKVATQDEIKNSYRKFSLYLIRK